MARKIKKEKKEKKALNKKKVTIISLITLAVIAIITTIIILVIVFNNKDAKPKFTDARSMNYETLIDILDTEEGSEDYKKYENDFYVYIFNSDYDKYPTHEIKDETLTNLNIVIDHSKKLDEYYDEKDEDEKERVAFYVLDVMDEKNEDILEDELFSANIEEGSFIIKVENQKYDSTDPDNTIKKDDLRGELVTIATELFEIYDKKEE